MKELNLNQIRMVSGAGAAAPATVANAAGAAAIVGAIAGIPGGPVGVVAGAVVGGLGVAIGSTVPSGNNSSGQSPSFNGMSPSNYAQCFISGGKNCG
ncbi:microcin H47 [Yersinia enterocolitica]|uniref:microcin H47 n=1 Tax=Yersinia enterocolitica TaxID=630 RepID=UPI003D7BA1B8